MKGRQKIFSGLIALSCFGVVAAYAGSGVISRHLFKTEKPEIENGAEHQILTINTGQFEVNQHFLLGQFFYDKYNQKLSGSTKIESNVKIKRIEVWLTNRSGLRTNVRDAVGLADLAESTPSNKLIQNKSDDAGCPRNDANDLYSRLTANPDYRFVDNAVSTLLNFGFQQQKDFEKTYARKLKPEEFTVNPRSGYISLNTKMNPNDVLAVAYQYEYKGKSFQVGDFSDQVPPDSSGTSKVLYLKLLKGTTPGVADNLSISNLMMKNVYSLGAIKNISKSSLALTTEGRKLKEGADYTVDYNSARITITNKIILNSGQQIKVDFENHK